MACFRTGVRFSSSPPKKQYIPKVCTVFLCRESNSEGLRRKAKQSGELFCRRKDGHTGTARRCGRMSNRMQSILNSPHLHRVAANCAAIKMTVYYGHFSYASLLLLFPKRQAFLGPVLFVIKLKKHRYGKVCLAIRCYYSFRAVKP